MTTSDMTGKVRDGRRTCRSCGSGNLMDVLNLGMMPLSDGLVKGDDLEAQQPTYPLEVAFCPDCSLVQILETVPPDVLFCRDYPYYSSFSQHLLEHSRRNALDLIDRCRLGGGSFVVELASNDGYLLKNFVERGIPVLGIDPAEGPARAAQRLGVPTMIDFFGLELARKLRLQGRRADVIIANNVLAHVADTNGFVEAIAMLLKDDGLAAIEVPYVRDLVDHCEFDTIYHEHLCYFSACALDRLFRRHGLHINQIKHLAIHGGSLRLYIQHGENPSPSFRELLALERQLGLDRYDYYRNFGMRVDGLRLALCKMLNELKGQGKRIAAYGAAAKGAILMNYIGAGRQTIDFVADRNVHKQGKYMPGVKVPIFDPSRILQDMPDYVLILAWNFKDEIIAQQQAYRQNGGRFIVPIPRPQIV